VKQDENLRGRPSGESSGLIREGALRAGLPASNITVVLPEREAVDAALRLAQPRDLVVIFADLINDVWQQITAFNGHASSSPSIQGEMNT